MRLTATLMLVIFTGFFVYTIILGHKSIGDISIIPKHKKWSSVTLAVLFGFVVYIEIIVQTMELAPRGVLFYTHMPFATGLLVAFLTMRFVFDGSRFPIVHRYLAYFCFICALVTIPTGMVLMWQ